MKTESKTKNMFKRFIAAMIARRHPWRRVGFDEIAEIYISRVMREGAIGMIVVFIGIYLFQLGYSLTAIGLFYVFSYGIRPLLAVMCAHLIARWGPKHATFISNLIYIPNLIALYFLETFGWPMLVISAFTQGLSVVLFVIAHDVNFSKVRHRGHDGKELGNMFAIDKITLTLSPLIGGFLAFILGPQAVLLIAAALFLVAALPLMSTPEPVKLHQHITFKKLNIRKTYKAIRAEAVIGFDFVASSYVWSIFIAIAIFSLATDAVYAQVGVLMSITVVATVAVTRLFGRIIDHKSGEELLKASVIAKTLVLLARPFASTPFGAVAVNLSNEVALVGTMMSFTRGKYDLADSLPGYRIVFLAVMSSASAIGAAMGSLALVVLSLFLSDIHALQAMFVLAAIVFPLIMRHGMKGVRGI